MVPSVYVGFRINRTSSTDEPNCKVFLRYAYDQWFVFEFRLLQSGFPNQNFNDSTVINILFL